MKSLRFVAVFEKVLSLMLVMGLSFSLLLFIGYSEVYRVYSSMQLDNICNQIEIQENAIEKLLLVGMPIEFEGFRTQTEGFAAQSDLVYRAAIERENEIAEEDNDAIALNCDLDHQKRFKKMAGNWMGLLTPNADVKDYKLVTSLENKISTVGHLSSWVKSEVFTGQIQRLFQPILLGALLVVVFSPLLIVLIQYQFFPRRSYIQQGLYHLSFLAISVFILLKLMTLYTSGITQKSASLSESLRDRFAVAADLGFDLKKDFIGIEDLMAEYARKDGDISHIFVVNDQRIIYQSITKAFQEAAVVPVSHCAKSNVNNTVNNTANNTANEEESYIIHCVDIDEGNQLEVWVPKSSIYIKLWSAARNFLVLFVASTLISNLFFNLLVAIQGSISGRKKPVAANTQPAAEISVIKPVYALGVLMETLSMAFLPAYLSEILSGTGHAVSTVYSAYFICLSLILIPAGRYAEKHSIKGMILAGLVLSSLGLLGLGAAHTFLQVIALRCIAGAGQGLLLIGVQSYLLRIRSSRPSGDASSVIVMGFNVATISGMAIGALLVPTIGEQQIFLLGAVIGVLNVFYCVHFIREPARLALAEGASVPKGTLREALQQFRDIDIAKAILLVGLPTKLLFAGVLIFFMPILLHESGYERELIGQIMVFYFVGVLLMTHLLSVGRQAHWRRTRVLFVGTLGGGLALMFLGAQQWVFDRLINAQLWPSDAALFQIVWVIAGVTLLGVFHGLIHAPVIDHVASSRAAHQYGSASTVANYRFMERVGQIFGPPLAALLLISTDNHTVIANLFYFGLAMLVASLLFVGLSPRKVSKQGESP